MLKILWAAPALALAACGGGDGGSKSSESQAGTAASSTQDNENWPKGFTLFPGATLVSNFDADIPGAPNKAQTITMSGISSVDEAVAHYRGQAEEAGYKTKDISGVPGFTGRDSNNREFGLTVIEINGDQNVILSFSEKKPK